MSRKFLVFLIPLVLNLSFSYADTKPHCNNIVSSKFLDKMKNNLPKMIEIAPKNNRKWMTHNFRMIKETYGVDGNVNETGGNLIISEKFKSRFKSTIHVYFDKRIKCTFKANIRQHGDFLDHIQLVGGNLFQSLDVTLKTGHINGITKFKLLIPETRNNPEDEIILTELLRDLGYLAPRTSFVKVKANNLTKTMLFQEKAEKEMLEYNLRREGPLLEGDERFMFSSEYKNSYGIITTQPSLSRQTNAKWAIRSSQHENISHEAITLFNLFYLKSRSEENLDGTFKEYNLKILDNKLLAYNNPEQILKLDIYNAILFSANGDHSLAQRNKKFYWNSLNNYFEPVYYDGDLNIDKTYENYGFKLQNLPNKQSFLHAIEESKKEIKKIDVKNFIKKVKHRKSSLSENEIKEKLNKILLNLDKLKNHVNTNGNTEDNQPITDKDILKDYANYTLAWGFDIFLVFRDLESKMFYACRNNKEKCEKIYLSNKQINDLLRGRLIINNLSYQYIGEYSDLQNTLSSFVLKEEKMDKYNKIKFKDTHFHFDKNISYQYDKKESVFNIYQKKSGARAYFLGGKIENMLINFHGLNDKIHGDLKNYPFDQNGLTGCLSFIKMSLKNISISAVNSDCEDSVNLINSTGKIEKFTSKNSVKDGLDIDFSEIEIGDINISSAKNDCADFSAGNYKINKLNLSNCGDKALSVGEESYIQLKEINVTNSNIGIASKDSSVTKLDNGYFSNLKTCVAAYNKKQEFFGGLLEAKNLECKNYYKKMDIDINSKIKVKNEL